MVGLSADHSKQHNTRRACSGVERQSKRFVPCPFTCFASAESTQGGDARLIIAKCTCVARCTLHVACCYQASLHRPCRNDETVSPLTPPTATAPTAANRPAVDSQQTHSNRRRQTNTPCVVACRCASPCGALQICPLHRRNAALLATRSAATDSAVPCSA